MIAVASPKVVERILQAAEFDRALLQEPLLAYNLELSLVDAWLSANRIDAHNLIPAMVGQDLRAHRNLLVQGIGWSVLPQFLCEKQLDSGELMLIPPPRTQTEINYYLIWLPSALRQPRVAHARSALLGLLQGVM